MERDRLVTAGVDPDDQRNRLNMLTSAGHAKLAEADRLWATAQRDFEIAFGRVESERLREALHFLVSDGFVATLQPAHG